MILQEKSANCFDCGVAFTFTIEEQLAYQARERTHTPKRCPSCREARKTRRLNSGDVRNQLPGLQLFPAICAQCGKTTQVPFEPKAGRPVYCRDCYQNIKGKR